MVQDSAAVCWILSDTKEERNGKETASVGRDDYGREMKTEKSENERERERHRV